MIEFMHRALTSALAPNEIAEDEAPTEEGAAAVGQGADAEFSKEEFKKFDKNHGGQIDGLGAFHRLLSY